MIGFVLDASVVLAWFFTDEGSASVDALWVRTDTELVHVPSHWYAEVANGMAIGERRGRSTAAKAEQAILVIENLRIDCDREGMDGALHRLLPLARLYRLTVYDAAYLELAMRRNLPLATLDAALAAAARAAGVAVVDLAGDVARS